jgi:hypothetical protein
LDIHETVKAEENKIIKESDNFLSKLSEIASQPPAPPLKLDDVDAFFQTIADDFRLLSINRRRKAKLHILNYLDEALEEQATETVPAATETVPAARETVPAARETVPAARETVPASTTTAATTSTTSTTSTTPSTAAATPANPANNPQ